MTKKYQRRDQRSETPQNIVIRPRDIELIETVYRNRVMTQDQLRRMFFLPDAKTGDGKEAAKRRLRLLFDNGYLERKVLPTLPGEGRGPNHYILGEQGVELLRRERGYTKIRWYKSSTDLKQDFIEHTVAISDVLVAVEGACLKLGYESDEWKSESQLKADYDYVTITTAKGKRERKPVIPDAFFVVNTGEYRYPCFVEIDRGTMQLNRFKNKVKAYAKYYRSRGYEKRYQFQSIRVLTVVSTQSRTGGDRRLAELKKTTEEATKANWFWFAKLSDISADTMFSEPIWYRLHEAEQQHLIAV